MLNYLTPNCMKYSYLYRIALYFVYIIALASCNNFLGPTSGEKKVIPIEQNPLYPLKVGNFWRYQTIKYNYITNRLDTINDISTTRIISDTVIKYRNQKYQCMIFDNNIGNYYFSSSKKVIQLQTFDMVSDTIIENSFIRFPLGVNDTIIGTYGIPFASRVSPRVDIYSFSSVCVGTNELFTTPVGTFHCYVLRLDLSQFTYWYQTGSPIIVTYSYYAPGVGRVGRTYKTINPNDPTRKEQFDYQEVLVEYLAQ